MERDKIIRVLEWLEWLKSNTRYSDEAEIELTISLINELTEEIEDLEEDYEHVYEQAEADIRGDMADGGASCHWCMDKTKADTVKRMQEMLKQYENAYVTTPCNFCKHSLKGNRNKRCDDDLQCLGFNKWESVIDQVAKELLEEQNNV